MGERKRETVKEREREGSERERERQGEYENVNPIFGSFVYPFHNSKYLFLFYQISPPLLFVSLSLIPL